MGVQLNEEMIKQLKELSEHFQSNKIEIKLPHDFLGQFQILSKQLVEASKRLKFIFKDYDDEIPWFIKNDWYLNKRWWSPMLAREVYSTDIIKLENKLIKKIDKEIAGIKKSLIDIHPERIEIIEELFQLYKKKYYHGVITLSYLLTDGICKKIYGIPFWGYDQKVKKNNAKKLSENIEFGNMDLSFERLLNRGIMNSNEKEIRELLEGNLCRCTGYQNIITAIQVALKSTPLSNN